MPKYWEPLDPTPFKDIKWLKTDEFVNMCCAQCVADGCPDGAELARIHVKNKEAGAFQEMAIKHDDEF